MKSDNLTLQGVSLDRLNDRVSLLKGFDSLDRKLDAKGTMDGMDAFNKQAHRHPHVVEAEGRHRLVEGRPEGPGTLRRG